MRVNIARAAPRAYGIIFVIDPSQYPARVTIVPAGPRLDLTILVGFFTAISHLRRDTGNPAVACGCDVSLLAARRQSLVSWRCKRMSVSLPILALLVATGAAGPAGSGEYWSEPRGDYEARRQAFLQFAAASTSGGLYSQIARLELGRGPIDDGAIQSALAGVRARRDRGDFVVNGLLRILSYRNSPLVTEHSARTSSPPCWDSSIGSTSRAARTCCRCGARTTRSTITRPSTWPGGLFPEDIFTNSGKTGRWHRRPGAGARAALDRHQGPHRLHRVGLEQLLHRTPCAALMNLAELARDPEVRQAGGDDPRRDVLRHGGRFVPGQLRHLARAHLPARGGRRRRDRGHHRPAAHRLGHGRPGQAGQRGRHLPGRQQALPGGAHHRGSSPSTCPRS